MHASDQIDLPLLADIFPMQPFREIAPEIEHLPSTRICAQDLFSIFTAGIILERAVFIR